MQWRGDADHIGAVSYAGDANENPSYDRYPTSNANSEFHVHIHVDTHLNTTAYPNPCSNIYSQAYVAARNTSVNWDAHFAITRAGQR